MHQATCRSTLLFKACRCILSPALASSPCPLRGEQGPGDRGGLTSMQMVAKCSAHSQCHYIMLHPWDLACSVHVYTWLYMYIPHIPFSSSVKHTNSNGCGLLCHSKSLTNYGTCKSCMWTFTWSVTGSVHCAVSCDWDKDWLILAGVYL